MSEDKGIIKVNSEFRHIGGKDIFERKGRRFNEYRDKWKSWPENFHTGEFPLFIDIEATNACNLHCPFCSRVGKKIKKGFISFDNVKKIINQGADNNLYGVKFSIIGEPLLHPQIHAFVKYAKQRGLIDVYFNTNAMLLTKETSRKLIDAGLDRISISFEGYTKGVYEKYRIGAKYETVLSNIENLQLLKGKLGVKHPRIRVQTVMLPALEHSLKEYEEFWAQRADEVGFISYQERVKTRAEAVRHPWSCSQIWQRMGILCDGTILACNHDDDGLIVLGNIERDTIKETWHSEKLNKIRDLHKLGLAHQIPACNACYLRNSEILKLTAGEEKK